MALCSVIIDNPNLDPVGTPIVGNIEYEVNRELNAAGSWAVSFTASEQLAAMIRSRWRVSIIEEGSPGYKLYRGIILDRSYRINSDGSAVVSLAGMSRLYSLMAQSTHQGLAYDGTQDIEEIANDLTGETVTAPADASTRMPTVTFNDTSKLDALLKALELARYNVRETFNEDGFELVSQDDVPDSGFRFVNVTQAGPELETAAADGMGLIAGAPVLGYSGKNLANRIIPIGVEWDGKELLLNLSDETLPYAIQTGVHPSTLSYYYLEDQDSIDEYGLVELQYVRSDVKNPSDDAGTRLAAANVLYALAAGELVRRKSEVISFGVSIANGYDIDALPGDRVRVQFRGTVQLHSGIFTYRDVDQDFLVVKRRDASTVAGVRDVAFTLAAYEIPLPNFVLPDAVAIPPPPGQVPDPPRRDDPNEDGAGDGAGDGTELPDDMAGGEIPTDMPTTPEIPTLPPELMPLPEGVIPGSPYEPCCAKNIAEIPDGGIRPGPLHIDEGALPGSGGHTGGSGGTYNPTTAAGDHVFELIYAVGPPAVFVGWNYQGVDETGAQTFVAGGTPGTDAVDVFKIGNANGVDPIGVHLTHNVVAGAVLGVPGVAQEDGTITWFGGGGPGTVDDGYMLVGAG